MTTSPADSSGQPALLCLADFEEAARSCLPHMAYEFLASGAADEHTLRWNREVFDSVALRPHVLREIGPVDTRVSLLGRQHEHPVLLAPVAYQGVLHPDGERATARGAAAAGATFMVSTNTNTAIEDIARETGAPLWFQLYMQHDRGATAELVSRAEAAGVEALVLTVDTPTIGPRNRQARVGFDLPPGLGTPHLADVNSGLRAIMTPGRASTTWKSLEWLLGSTRVPVLIKGVLDPDDAARGVESGVAGIFVSNHGGRNLDTAPATLAALPAVVARVDGRVPVLMDGGIRRGTDIVKALALGADAVAIGRPYCYGLAVSGAAGVERVIRILREELEMAMLLLGVERIAELDRRALWEDRSADR